MLIKDALLEAKTRLKKAGVLEPEASAEVLLCAALQREKGNKKKEKRITRADLYTRLDQHLSATATKCYEKFIKRRLANEPVWQIIGEVEFWGMLFKVTKDVLVPRPETEFLVEAALQEVKGNKKRGKSCIKILDVGTGSGAIAVALAKECQIINAKCQIYASDFSNKALSVARKNTSILLSTEVKFKRGNLFEPWKGMKFDLVTANLPYIPHEEMESLALDVYHYEPRLALDGGKEGLEIYERFLSQLPSHLKPSGVAICEIGINQGKVFCTLVKKYLPGYKCEIKKDFADIDRIAEISSR